MRLVVISRPLWTGYWSALRLLTEHFSTRPELWAKATETAKWEEHQNAA
jgi:hypothetical protein